MDTYILIRGARQLLTLHGPPGIRRGHAMNDLGVIEDGSVLIRNDQIAAVGPTRRLENLREARDAAVIPANGRVVMPGFIDPDLRVSSGAAERSARRQNLGRMAQETSSLLRAALQHGTTRAEIKLGGSTPLEELKALKSAKRLGDRGEQFVGTWRARPLAGETAKDAIESRRPHFEYVSRKMRNSFLEVETRSETVESAGWLFGEGARRRLPVKLSWIGGSEEALLDLLAAFSPRTISRLQPATERLAAALLENQTILTMGGGEPALRQDARAFCVREFVNANGGIALSSGYDPFESPTFNMQMTIALAVARMELTPEEAITAATVNAAYAIGAGPQVGTLETGKQADLLVLNLTSYGDLPRQFGINHVGMAIRAGEVVFNRIGWKPPRLESGGSRT